MTNYEEMDPMVAAEVFGADFREALALAGISPEEFFFDVEDETGEEA